MPPKKRQRNGDSSSSTQNGRPAKRTASSAQHPTLSPPSSGPDVVDLTQPTSVIPVPSPGPRSSWAQPTTQADDDDEVIEMTQSDESSAPIEFYGSLDNKIVGVRYYNGVVTPGERVVCRREAGNPYDSNAIRIDNAMQSQIGHLPRALVKKLAPYIDHSEVVMEGVVTGDKAMFDCPIRIMIYGPSEPDARRQLETRLKADKLLKATQLKSTKQEAEVRRKASELGLRHNSSVAGLGSGEDDGQNVSLSQLHESSETMDPREEADLLKGLAMDQNALSKLPMAAQPEGIASQLLPYQLQGLAWMMSKESPQLPPPASQGIVQLWKRDRRNNFFNLASGFASNSPPRLLSGGILADDMGLGKTIQIISLILAQGNASGPTLIIAPVGVMSNWEEQALRHVNEQHMPRILRYHGSQKGKGFKKDDFLNHDIVITSYGKLLRDHQTKTGLFSVDWRRIVLDEGHVIRNPRSGTAKAACDLSAKSRWVLTGTPIVNNREDFQSLLQFLRITGGLEDVGLFKSIISRPLSLRPNNSETAADYQRAKNVLQALFRDLCLRRMKNMKFVDLKLPKKTEYIHRINFSEDEKRKYDALLREAQGALESFQGNQEAAQQTAFSNVLERLLRLRQVCCHWTLAKDRVKDVLKVLDGQNVVQLTKENLEILQKALEVGREDGEECSICYESIDLHSPVITTCKHLFGRPCIVNWVTNEGRGNCPQCRAKLTEDSLVEPLQKAEHEARDFDPQTRSSKTEGLLEILKLTLKDNPQSKVVVFSQWTSFLDVIQHVLKEESYEFSRIDGKMSPEQRDRSITALKENAESRIMLASLSACSVGLNLVAADTVVLMDSWWAPAIEDQAIDRVHRLGQPRPVTVWRMVMNNSVEERVIKVQAEKRKLVGMAFKDEKRGKKARESTSADIKKLLYGAAGGDA